jgi:hypothetical protein
MYTEKKRKISVFGNRTHGFGHAPSKNSTSSRARVLTGIRVVFGEEGNEIEGPTKLQAPYDIFTGWFSPGMECVDIEDRPETPHFNNRIITSKWILRPHTKVFGAYNATVDAAGDVVLWKPSSPDIRTSLFFFTTRPEQAIKDTLEFNSTVCNSLSAGFGVAAAVSAACFVASFFKKKK